ncbi:unnamed protein product, partial [Larinioides sclopetarius]
FEPQTKGRFRPLFSHADEEIVPQNYCSLKRYKVKRVFKL